MSRVWFAEPLETAAVFWRIMRRDGVTLGFTTHDRDLWFDGVLHRAAPGMTPAAIRRSADLEPDSAEVDGALSHDAIRAEDLASGRFDGASLRVGLVDWASGVHDTLYGGKIGSVTEEDGRFSAELASRKAMLLDDFVPRTSPACRAPFCGPGCNLASVSFTHEAVLVAVDAAANAISIATAVSAADLPGGFVRWLDGPQAGVTMTIMAQSGGSLVLDVPLEPALQPGTRAIVREGCDHTLETCATRFGNAANFQGEPFLPGNDLLTRYPAPGGAA